MSKQKLRWLLLTVFVTVSAQSIFAQILDLPVPETWRLTMIGETGGFREIVDASIDPAGNVYIVDRESNMVHKLDRNVFVERSIGGYGWGNHEFDRPSGIWAENGVDVFVADYGNHRIQRFDRRLSYVGTLETRTTGFEIEQFGYPVAVTMNRQGDLYVVDEENLRVVSFGGLDRHRKTFGGMEAGRFRISSPRKIEIYGDDLIAIRDGTRLLFFDQFGSPYREFSSRFLPAYKDLSIVGEHIFLLMDETIDVYRGELQHPVERINLLPYISDPGDIKRITASSNRIVLMSDETVWVFQILR